MSFKISLHVGDFEVPHFSFVSNPSSAVSFSTQDSNFIPALTEEEVLQINMSNRKQINLQQVL